VTVSHFSLYGPVRGLLYGWRVASPWFIPTCQVTVPVLSQWGSCLDSVMLNYAGEYCDAYQTTLTVIRSSDTALKSCLEWLTMSGNVWVWGAIFTMVLT